MGKIGLYSEGKPKVIVIDGVDGVGKTTLRVALSRLEGSINIIERYTPSIYAYGKLEDREIDLKYLHDIEERITKLFKVYPFLLTCRVERLYERYLKNRHAVKLSLADLIYLQREMTFYVNNLSKLSWIKLDVSFSSPQEVVEEVVKWVST